MGTLVVNSDFGKLYGVSRTDYFSKYYLTFEAVEDCVFTFTMDAKLPTICVPSISFSIDDGNNWTETANVDGEEVVVTTPTIKAGDKVLWKSNAVQFCYQTDTAEVGSDMPLENAGFSTFKSSGKYNIYGNIMSLLYGDNFTNKKTFKPYVSTGYGAGAFTYLFTWNYGWAEYWDDPTKFNEKIISTKYLSLPATTLADYCYYGLFLSCNKMVDCPELPSTNLAAACYKEMFYLCDSMLVAPELPATEMKTECYREMIDRCRSLKVAPELPATTLAPYCYMGMFSTDPLLTKAPELPATELEPYCYYGLFYNNTGLITPPSELPATVMKERCYNGLFSGCSSLKYSPSLPATTLAPWCYYGMYMGCLSLEEAPKLPAMTLTDSCYRRMFDNCPSLTTAPVLPATELVANCYIQMFRNCSKLSYIKALFTTTPSNTTTSNWVQNVASNGTFVKNSSATWTNTGTNAVPNGWQIETN